MSDTTDRPEGLGVICARCNRIQAGEFVTVGGRVLCRDCRDALDVKEKG